MTFSTTSTGSKRSAIEDQSSQPAHDHKKSKRLKASKKPSSNGDQTISHYFTRNNNKTSNMPASSHDSSLLASNSPATLQRKDRSITPPSLSRHKVASEPTQLEKTSTQEQSQLSKHETGVQDDDSAINITHHVGDIFDAPVNALLVHACNCRGSWGKGIAAAFKREYPKAFKIYERHCKQPKKQILGKALLIPPQPGDRHQHYVGTIMKDGRPTG